MPSASGPGDPGLLTLQAANILKRCPVIAAPQTKSGQMLALDIARRRAESSGEGSPAAFASPCRSEPSLREESYQTAARQIEAFLQKGLDVAMVNLGDVSVFATAYYILERIREDGFRDAHGAGCDELLRRGRKTRLEPHRDGSAASHHPRERGFGLGAANFPARRS